MKKKIIDIILIFILIVILLINNVNALSSKIILSYEKNEEFINVTVKLEELDSKINAMSANIEYDNQKLKIDRISNLNDWSNTYSEENSKITLIKLAGTDKNEEVFKIKFKIEDKNNIDNTEILLTNITISDGNEEIQIQDTTIKVIDNNIKNNNINNTVNNKVNNTVNNKVNNTVNNKVNNTVNNRVNNTSNNRVNNIVNNKVNNRANNKVINNKNLQNNKISNDSTVKTDIPYAGITTYIRIALIVVLTIGLIVYIKYRQINKII